MERKILHIEDGGHDYSAYPNNYDCQYHCGCWVGKIGHGRPDDKPNLDPLGKCPENPRNKEAKKTLPWER